MKKMDRVQKAIITLESTLVLALAIVGASIGYANMDKDLDKELSKLPATLTATYDGEIVIVDYISKNVDGRYFVKSHKIEILSNCHSLAHELNHSYYNSATHGKRFTTAKVAQPTQTLTARKACARLLDFIQIAIPYSALTSMYSTTHSTILYLAFSNRIA